MKKTYDLCCPHCGSSKGVYITEYGSMELYFDFLGHAEGVSEFYTDRAWKRYRCRSCNRMLPRELSDKIQNRIDSRPILEFSSKIE